MSGPRLYLLLGAAVTTALTVASIAANLGGRSLIDTRVFVVLTVGDAVLWISFTVVTCTGIVLRLMIDQETQRGARVAGLMRDNGLGDLDARRSKID